MRRLFAFKLLATLALLLASALVAAEPAPDTSRGDKLLAEALARETFKLRDDCLAEIKTLDDWHAKKGEYRRQLFEMLGLDPLPERTDLKPVITGTIEKEDFVVEKLHFQSQPGLYVTANLYRPKEVKQPLPTILYVCGHGRVAKDGVSYGNKTHYQHHGAWFARNGYVCLVLDTLQLGEIEGDHHGTYKLNQWWWVNRGYTPAGVEAWNCIRALDYLETRPEVDKAKFGVTGRSGGGAYSWWIAALDERIQCAVPVAGITDLENHVVDGCVEGHCDCMFMVNTYRWDYPQVAALVAPRPLLLSNTDSDPIFPLDGVVRTYDKVRRIYRLHKAGDKCGLNITAGGHVDTQELQVHAFRWLNQHLKGESGPVEKTAVKFFEPAELKVFAELPADQINTRLQETFIPAATPGVPETAEAWTALKNDWREHLKSKVFAGLPLPNKAPTVRVITTVDQDGLRLTVSEFETPDSVPLQLLTWRKADLEAPKIHVLNVLDEQSWGELRATLAKTYPLDTAAKDVEPNEKEWLSMRAMLDKQPWVMSYVAPRGIGPTAFNPSDKKQTQNRRRYYLLGQTLDGMQTLDVVAAMRVCQADPTLGKAALWLQSQRNLAGVSLYAAILGDGVKRLDLYDLPTSHRNGPIFLNIERKMNMPQAVALAAENTQVVIYGGNEDAWRYPRQVSEKLRWESKRLQLRKAPPGE